MRRVAFWAAVASPLLVIGVALLIGGILHLFGANCVTYGNNPMALDNEIVCNDLGEIGTIVGWTALGLALLFVPVAFISGAVGGWRARRRRSP